MVDYPKLEMLIDGEWIGADKRQGEDVLNPATAQPLAKLPHATKADLDRALEAAQRGFQAWRKVNAHDRAKILRKASDLIRERKEQIATWLTLEEGKTFVESKIEVDVSADILEWYAEEGRRAYGRIIPGRVAGQRQMVTREPVGPVAAFTPWNFPGVTPARKLGGALAAGCSIILKASEETPAVAIALVKALVEAGVPKGAVNLVFGVPSEISSYLVPNPIIRKVSFTGSVPVGKHLAKMAAEGMKRTTMELGGHGPVVIFDDVDADKVAEVSAAAKYRNAGQVCISPTRFFVHEKVADKFSARFAEIAKTLPVGDGLDPKSKMGPLANPRRVDAMGAFIADARDHGAKVSAGGERIGNQGFFWQPTVLTDVPTSAKAMNDEIFGPIAVIRRFSTFDEVVAEANRLPFGLAGYAFTNSAKNAAAISEALETGMVGVNHYGVSMPETPFGGVKDSGYGSEGGVEGLEGYLSTKFVTQI
jgi:succinate-semialdehyde dehydrogenase/glutarate-semialdehyde dehydrogenase